MDSADQLVEQMFSWIEKRENCAKQLKKLADELETLRGKCNAAECVGSSVSVIGAASLFGAAVVTFVTGGVAAPALACAGGICGVGVAASVTTKIIEHFSSSNTLKSAEKIEEENNKTVEEIKKQFKQLKVEVKRMYPSADPDQVDRHVMTSFMGAVARRRSRSLQIDFSRLANEPGFFSGTQHNMMDQPTTNRIRPAGLGAAVLGVLTFFTFRAEGQICQEFIATAAILLTLKIAKTGLKTALKRGAMVVGAAVGLAFALHEAIDHWKNLLGDNGPGPGTGPKASQSMRETADDILKTCRVLRGQLHDIEEKVHEWAATQEQEDRP